MEAVGDFVNKTHVLLRCVWGIRTRNRVAPILVWSLVCALSPGAGVAMSDESKAATSHTIARREFEQEDPPVLPPADELEEGGCVLLREVPPYSGHWHLWRRCSVEGERG